MKTKVADFLKNYLVQKQKKNPSYSSRAFARDLGLSSGSLSDILNGHLFIGLNLFQKISKNAKLEPHEQEEFYECYVYEQQNKKVYGRFKRHLQESEYTLIAQPEHYEILALMETHDFKSDHAWIAKRLRLSVEKVEAALERLLALKMIKIEVGGAYTTVRGGVTTTHDIPSKVIQESHKNVIMGSLKSLENDPIDQRDFTSITMAINPAKVKEAKALLRDFRRRLCKVMGTGTNTEVYTLNMQLFPNSHRSEKL